MFEFEEIRELSIIEQFRESHHAVAMMYAAGMTDSMVRQRTGYSIRRLTLLKGTPAFRELVAHYHNKVRDKFEENADTYLGLGIPNMIKAERQIADRLDAADDPDAEPIPLLTLNRISQDRADRFGYSKHSTMRVEHSFGDRLDSALARSDKAKLIDAKPSPNPAAAGEGRRGLLTERPREAVASQRQPDVPRPPSIRDVLKRRLVA